MKKIILTGLIVIFGLAGCNNYFDINQNPNSPTEDELNPSVLFPGAEMNLANHYGDYLRIVGGYFAEHYAQTFGTSNYLDYSQWIMSATRSDRAYSQLSTLCLYNLESVRNMATQTENWSTYLAATTLRAFTYQVLVDAYGELPYTEAFQGINNLNPKYDDGQVIYEGILKELDDALAKVDPSDLSDKVCTNFLFGTTTVDEWIQLANAVKLKILMRMSNVADVKSQLAALIAEGNFPTQDVSWSGFWENASGKANPFYQEEFATYFGSTQVNVVGNLAIVQTMQSSDDARLGAMFSKNSSGNFTGAVSGSNFSGSTYTAGYWCRPKISYNTPVYLITVAEIEFFLAEYYARYGGGDAKAHYQAAVEASFNTLGVSGADQALTDYPWDDTNYKQVIGIQKWIALAGVNNFEAWCELRRLKYPAFGSVSGSDLYDTGSKTYSPNLYVPGTLYTPILCNTELGASTVLQRFPYAISSSSHNANAPATKSGNVPVFWAK